MGTHGELLQIAKTSSGYLVDVLLDSGRWLWDNGKAYWRYSKLINSLSPKKGEVRRNLGRAWDLAFAWQDFSILGEGLTFKYPFGELGLVPELMPIRSAKEIEEEGELNPEHLRGAFGAGYQTYFDKMRKAEDYLTHHLKDSSVPAAITS